MINVWRWVVALMGSVALLVSLVQIKLPVGENAPSAPSRGGAVEQLHYEFRQLPHSQVHLLMIPAGGKFVVSPAIATETESLEKFVQREGAIAGINGGFFDPMNQRSTSFVIVEGRVVADPRHNDRLMDNPNLLPYLSKILDRTEFRTYRCKNEIRYAIVRNRDAVPTNCWIVGSLGGGPQLLPTVTAQHEAFVDVKTGRDAIGVQRRQARSAIGRTRDGRLIWVMVAQKPEDPGNSGMSLSELAALMAKLGAETAMNLDGGSSAAFYYQGKTTAGSVDLQGQPVDRPVKSVLLVKSRS